MFFFVGINQCNVSFWKAAKIFSAVFAGRSELSA